MKEIERKIMKLETIIQEREERIKRLEEESELAFRIANAVARNFFQSHKWLEYSIEDRWRIWKKPVDMNDPEIQIRFDIRDKCIQFFAQRRKSV